jgi:hypothetical protein
MGYTQAKASVNNIKVQVHQQPNVPYMKDERIILNGSQKTGFLRRGVSMIETILSVFILLAMSLVFKFINAKQKEFDRLEDKRR